MSGSSKVELSLFMSLAKGTRNGITNEPERTGPTESIGRIGSGGLKPGEAARLMGLSVRQVRRLIQRYREEGDQGIIHRLRGRESNRKIPEMTRDLVLSLIRGHYEDFGPTLVSEYLEGESGLRVSKETLRRWMMEEGLWKARRRKEPKRQRRARRACWGELVQMDTSIHDWLEGRGEEGVLIAMIDDATSRVWMRFYPTDSTETNMALIREYLRRYGRPLAVYADKASHFRINLKKDGEERPGQTQIQRALRQLEIEYMLASERARENTWSRPPRLNLGKEFTKRTSSKTITLIDLRCRNFRWGKSICQELNTGKFLAGGQE